MSPEKIEKLLSKAEDNLMMVAAAVADGEAEISETGYQMLTNIRNQTQELQDSVDFNDDE